MKEFFYDIRQGIADAITSDIFPPLFIISIISFGIGIIVGCGITIDSMEKQCDQMSITESLKYPYCRNYFEQEIKRMDEEDGK